MRLVGRLLGGFGLGVGAAEDGGDGVGAALGVGAGHEGDGGVVAVLGDGEGPVGFPFGLDLAVVDGRG